MATRETTDIATVGDFEVSYDVRSRINYARAACSLYNGIRGYILPEEDDLNPSGVDGPTVIMNWIKLVKEYCTTLGLDYDIFKRYYNMYVYRGKFEYEKLSKELRIKYGFERPL